MRGNRKFLPKGIVYPSNELVKRLQRGESPFRLSENLACVTWKDMKFATCCQTEGIRNRSSRKESQIRRPVVNEKLCSAKSNQNIVFLAIESANKAEINILSARDTFNLLKCCRSDYKKTYLKVFISLPLQSVPHISFVIKVKDVAVPFFSVL